ncbi:MAG: hypothetical protein D6726_09200 [Nitrospirae bacterium]|nr:MAG: hypothetical protein D6726_09200 [Nitrospirota bacterium]
MVKAEIDPGICGLKTTVVVRKKSGKEYEILIESDCEMVEKLGEKVPSLNMMDIFKRITDNPIYKEGTVCLRHVSCPVPSGILKALEVEAGLALPKDVKIVFSKEK